LISKGERCTVKARKRNNADSANTTGMDQERMLFCVLHHPVNAETHNISPGEQKRKGFPVGIKWLGDRDLRTTRSIAQIFVGVVFNVLSHL
jgi:hypothetical protein